MESKNEKQWKNVSKYWKAEFHDEAKLKKPLIQPKKRKVINNLLKNDHLTVKGVHNNMIERVVFSD